MKQSLILALSLCLIFSACEKSKDDDITGKDCQIATATFSTHKYDADGRLINLSHSADPVGTSYIYSKDMIQIQGSKGIPDITMKLVNGRVTETISKGNSIVEYLFSYDSDGYLSKSVRLDGGEVHTYTYSYTDGNLMKIEGTKLSNGRTTNHPTVTFERSSESSANIRDIGLLIDTSFPFTTYKMDKYLGKGSKNLVLKKIELGTTLTYTYTKDVNGNIKSVKRNDQDAYIIEYKCK